MKNVSEIRLPGGLIVSLDAGDVDRVSLYSWHAMQRGHTFYARHTLPLSGGKRPALLMHRFILGVTDPVVQVDHRDGNGLNNRRENLRVCTSRQNIVNSRRRIDNVTGFKGVGFNSRIGRYHARIFANGKAKYLGSYATAAKAHAAYCAAAESAFGEFARFN